ncbi:hypothetical protein MJO52_11960 [Microbulbifer variabilis]|uniref:Alpha/beta hydrolase n=1 Tax=Microbulbifer variabilis TaxID=266805 RepID=A0ABY4V696_9GAMM|nr:hypothetical protein [Microbulbifer variabilis]USD19798.1 hypothetical protein MJO52_11960 [Microbulbifer variabilis]
MTEPRTFIAGDSISWSRTLHDYLPEDGWTLILPRFNGHQSQTGEVSYAEIQQT